MDKGATTRPAQMSDDALAQIYQSLKLIRRVEEAVAEIYPTDKIKSPVHLSIGQEAVAVGVCDVLRADDVVSGTYRGHATYLAKGGDVDAMLAELYGKSGGCALGKGGSMHLIGMEHGILGTSAVVGSTVPIACGYAFALKREGKSRVVAAFHGDGATEEGAFWESLNFAALHKLPILFVCENNGYAIHEPLEKRWAVMDLCAKVAAFGLPVIKIDDGCVFAIRAATEAAIGRMRAGEGPQFMECKTYRWREHVGPADDHSVGYRPRAPLEAWQRNDQVVRLAAMVEPKRRAEIDAAIEHRIKSAIAYAEASPVAPDEELMNHVFAH